MHCFLLNITGPHSLIGDARQMQLWGPGGGGGGRGLSRASLGGPGEGPLWGPRGGASNFLGPALFTACKCQCNTRHHYNTNRNNIAGFIAHHDCHFNVLVGHLAASATAQLTLHQRNVDVVSHVTCTVQPIRTSLDVNLLIYSSHFQHAFIQWITQPTAKLRNTFVLGTVAFIVGYFTVPYKLSHYY